MHNKILTFDIVEVIDSGDNDYNDDKNSDHDNQDKNNNHKMLVRVIGFICFYCSVISKCLRYKKSFNILFTYYTNVQSALRLTQSMTPNQWQCFSR